MTLFNSENKNKTFHFIGIGGIGLSALAELLHKKGYKIQGSDIKNNSNIENLKKKNIKIFLKHEKKNINSADIIVKSSVIQSNNIEILEAILQNKIILSRKELLKKILDKKYVIAISGSHGKTTTTALIGEIFYNANLDPTIICGGIMKKFNSNLKIGNSNLYIVEADESDGTFYEIPRNIAVLTNIDNDHTDFYNSFENLLEKFKLYISNLQKNGFAILNIDQDLISKINLKENNVTFGIKNKKANIIALTIDFFGFFSNFSVKIKNKQENFTLNLPGIHNVYNAIAAIATSIKYGIQTESIKNSIKNFSGVEKRYNIVYKKKFSIIHDYAHHPTAISKTIDVIRNLSKSKIICIIEPHKFSRVKLLFNEYMEVIKKIDICLMIDVFPAGEKNDKNFSSEKIVNEAKKNNSNKVIYIKNQTELNNVIINNINTNDYITFMGSGIIDKWVENLKNFLNTY